MSISLRLTGILLLLFSASMIYAQSQTYKGKIVDITNGDPLIGANVVIEGTSEGTISDFNGEFLLKTTIQPPFTIQILYLGYVQTKFEITDVNQEIYAELAEESVTLNSVELIGQRVSDKQRQNPLTVESLDILAIKETPSANFYDGLGSLKDVDLTTASLGFTVINTRGFNSTSPVRSLQIIDGVDNQSPGLNFSLGNFLGASELDIRKVDLIVGASSAYYGPNAFNGVISMETKDPFLLKGLSVKTKIAERNLFESSLRWADAFKNKNGKDWMAYKFNLFYLQANDWEATNYDPVFESKVGVDNPGGYDAVNIYGDEYNRTVTGMGTYHRNGYKEVDLVDYNTQNYKAGLATHFRLKPDDDYESPEIVLSSNFGGGTTVYQGDNRFSLKDIRFYQHKAELRKFEKYFLRFYVTHEDAGKSYDPFFTALKLQEQSKLNKDWNTAYLNHWQIQISPQIKALEGYPSITDYIGQPDAYKAAIAEFVGGLDNEFIAWHDETKTKANAANSVSGDEAFLEPGTDRFDEAFNGIVSKIANLEGGSRFYDKSALSHLHGEYNFDDLYSSNRINDIDVKVGANGRMYFPDSKGSILLDTNGVNINTYEFGIYAGTSVAVFSNKLRINGTARVDKHENFDYLFSPAASIVFTPSQNNYLRITMSSAIRNPTLTDQYLNYNVGPALLRGNITGVNDLYELESFEDFLNSGIRDTLIVFDIPAIQPEQVRTFELGYRTTLFNALYADIGYYFSRYKNFIGYEIGIIADIPETVSTPSNVQVLRVSSNAKDIVTTQGFSIGLNYFFAKYYQVKGNYSWNILNTKSDDPIIPAFNTPEHKFNMGLSGRNMQLKLGSKKIKNIGASINYKWIQGFIYEGSPQFTGYVPTYDLLDVQINWKSSFNTTFKLGASNVLNNKSFQTYGGPRIGRMVYFSVLYEWEKK